MSLIRAENNHICWLTDLGDATMWRCQKCGIQVTAPDRETAERDAKFHVDADDIDFNYEVDNDAYHEMMGEYFFDNYTDYGCKCQECKVDGVCDEVREAVCDNFDAAFTNEGYKIKEHEPNMEKFEESQTNCENDLRADENGDFWGINGLITKI